MNTLSKVFCLLIIFPSFLFAATGMQEKKEGEVFSHRFIAKTFLDVQNERNLIFSHQVTLKYA